jgi:hypothetical protein
MVNSALANGIEPIVPEPVPVWVKIIGAANECVAQSSVRIVMEKGILFMGSPAVLA